MISHTRRSLLMASAAILSAPALARLPHGAAQRSVLAPDGFANGMYFPENVQIGTTTTTSVPLASGFVRGVPVGGTWNFATINTTMNPFNGIDIRSPTTTNPYFVVTVTSTTAHTTYFTVNLTTDGQTLAGSGGPTGSFPYGIIISATDSASNTYTQDVWLWISLTNSDWFVSGGNVLPDTQAPVSGVWTLTGGATVPPYTLTAPTSVAPDALIPDSQFPSFIRFFGDATDNQTFGGRATSTANPSFYPTPPCFFACFWRPEDNVGFGEPYAYGCQQNQFDGGAIALIMEGNRIIQWTTAQGSTEATTITNMSEEFTAGPFLPNGGGCSLGQWMFSAMVFPTDPTSASNPAIYYQNGLFGTGAGFTVPWIPGYMGLPLEYSFGSDGDRTPPYSASDSHVFNGGVRNCVSVSGVPLDSELEAMRNGGDPRTIWPGRVLSYYLFDGTYDPEKGQQEPDVTGNNGSCTFVNTGTFSWAPPPQVAQNGVGRLADRSGNFQMVNVSGSSYAIKTTATVTSLSAIYGSWNVLLIGPNGFYIETTLYVTAGSY